MNLVTKGGAEDRTIEAIQNYISFSKLSRNQTCKRNRIIIEKYF